ncbi:hypothetical protein C0J52_27430 [Blattella germanica]|nr:hypothetical protein C0J52_27430 [Blattella germanica]
MKTCRILASSGGTLENQMEGRKKIVFGYPIGTIEIPKCPREKGQFKGKGCQKQMKSTSTALVEDTTGSEEEEMSIHDDSSDEHEKVSKSVVTSGLTKTGNKETLLKTARGFNVAKKKLQERLKDLFVLIKGDWFVFG